MKMRLASVLFLISFDHHPRKLVTQMIHYTCDRCRRVLDGSHEPRLVVQIDVQVVSAEPNSDEESTDHLAELHESLLTSHDGYCEADCSESLLANLNEALQRGDDLDLIDGANLPSVQEAQLDSEPKQFDLCPECYAKYSRNPLSRERSLNLQFSDN